MPVLSDVDIIAARNSGEIIIEPFDENNLTSVAYDLSLGSEVILVPSEDKQGVPIVPLVDVTDKSSIAHGWMEAKISLGINYSDPVSCIFDHRGKLGLVIKPHGCAIVATKEFAGTADGSTIVPHIKGRSTLIRAGISVAPGAGWGDVGFFSRWGVLLKNNSPNCVFIPFDTRIAQIIFETVSSHPRKSYRDASGSYAIKMPDITERGSLFSSLKSAWGGISSVLPPI